MSLCGRQKRIYIKKRIESNPKPPVAVFRSRTMSVNDLHSENPVDINSNRSENSKPAACWYEWTIFDCAHGEQMMVPKFLNIIIEKVKERSNLHDHDAAYS